MNNEKTTSNPFDADIQNGGKAMPAVKELKQEQKNEAARKEVVMKAEEKNDRHIFIRATKKNWWKIVDRSVVYYTEIVEPVIGERKRANVWPDEDFTMPSRYGEIRIPSIEPFIKKILDAGFTLDQKLCKPSFIAINLKNRVTPEEWNLMIQKDEAAWEASKKMLLPAQNWANLKYHVCWLNKTMYEQVRKMDGPTRQIYGVEMMALVKNIVLTFNRVCLNMIPAEDGLNDMMAARLELNGYMIMALDLRIFDLRTLKRLGEAIESVNVAIVKEKKKLNRNRLKGEMEEGYDGSK